MKRLLWFLLPFVAGCAVVRCTVRLIEWPEIKHHQATTTSES